MTTDADPTAREGGPKAKVFISYSRKDLAFADRVDESLKARGFAPLIDREQIYVFDPWWERIQTLITQADTIVFVISPDAVGSDVCQKEVAFAASLNKRFAPVVCRRVDDRAVPEPLRRLKPSESVMDIMKSNARRVAGHASWKKYSSLVFTHNA